MWPLSVGPRSHWAARLFVGARHIILARARSCTQALVPALPPVCTDVLRLASHQLPMILCFNCQHGRIDVYEIKVTFQPHKNAWLFRNISLRCRRRLPLPLPLPLPLRLFIFVCC